MYLCLKILRPYFIKYLSYHHHQKKKKKSLLFLWPSVSCFPQIQLFVRPNSKSHCGFENKWGGGVHLLLFSASHHLIPNLISTWILFLVQYTTFAQMLMTEKGLTQGKKRLVFLQDSLF